ncbi:MAG: alpha-2-macroglobulin family protein, partial [Flavobacteriales bacterium]
VYFKGLLISKLENESNVVPNKNVEVIFFDANGKEIEKKTIKTNEYGTVSGNFTTPQGLLNGRMKLQMKSGNRNVANKYIQVEEYKRPKFEVSISPIKGEYKLGDNIKLEGIAKAFAGNMIDGAKVQYRVSRTASFPWWCWYYYGYNPTSAEVEIINGVTTTDEKGVFEVKFDAIADNSVNKKYSPTFSYQITADVTDLNGETRSTSQTVSVGYNSLIVNLHIPQKVNRSKGNKFKVSSTNLNGEKVEAKGVINIYALNKKPRIIKKEKWSNPDIFLITESEHNALYPNRSYGNKSESELIEQAKGDKFTVNFNTKESNEVEFDKFYDWSEGEYQMEIISKDKFGNEVKEIKTFTVYDDKATTIPTQEYCWTKAEKSTVEPGETAVFLIGTKANNVKVLYELEHQGKIIKKEWWTLNNEQKRIEIPIEEKHRGGITAHVVFVKDNHVFMKNFTAQVPFTNKQLDITFETFRNKLLPGQKEKWKVNVKGKNGDRVMAEMLGTMYDASLDEFASNSFGINIYNSYYSQRAYNYSRGFGMANAFLIQDDWNNRYVSVPSKSYDRLNWFGMRFYNLQYAMRGGIKRFDGAYASEAVMDFDNKTSADYNGNEDQILQKLEAGNVKASANAMPSAGINDGKKDGKFDEFQPFRGSEFKAKPLSQVKARTNFNETAFFLPHLTTDKDGNISFEFEMPEALAKWKFLGIAHTKDMRIGHLQKEIITQKELMVVPNVPRFLREGDKITISSKISNISENALVGKAQLFLFDALTDKPIDTLLMPNYKSMQKDPALRGLLNTQKQFMVEAEQSTSVEWQIEIPFGIQAVKYKIVAQAGNFTDGEENALPVLTNRMLVTESMSLPIKTAGTHTFNFDKLKNSGSSTSLKHHKVTLEYTSNPAWYVVQAMPYMMEYPYDCAEQTFTRFYANSLATHIMNGNPKIKQIIEAWKTDSPDEFLSNLEKNQELKAVILEQTPWVLEAENQTERKKRISQLFDLNKMSGELARALDKLQKQQKPSGGWAWFEGMKESRYITQHIATGMGHLDNLGVKNVRADAGTWNMTKQAINFLDNAIADDLVRLKRFHKNYKEEHHLSNIQIQYLYARSFFKDLPIPNATKEAFDYYLKQSQTYWLSQNNYSKAMIGLANFRYGKNTEVCKLITASLKENSIVHPELGMYWKGMMDGGYYWYQAPIETQALMIELFDVVANDQETVNELKTWLLKQKQTTDWKTTKATAEACYALLLNGTDLLANEEKVAIKVGNIDIAYSGADSPTKRVVKANEGTGYFKTSWDSGEVTPSMGTVSVTKKKDGVAWGAMYWQYFEDLDKITPLDTPLKIKKKLFIEKNTEKGKVLDPISENNVLNVGDKIIVRIEIQVDRNMEYIHMKDMRASGFEPINVISRYKSQDGLGYYESTKDASTDFFMDYLPRGTYVFEYPLRASQKGNFSNGVTSIQCMYAPEFGSHSEGIRVEVK